MKVMQMSRGLMGCGRPSRAAAAVERRDKFFDLSPGGGSVPAIIDDKVGVCLLFLERPLGRLALAQFLDAPAPAGGEPGHADRLRGVYENNSVTHPVPVRLQH